MLLILLICLAVLVGSLLGSAVCLGRNVLRRSAHRLESHQEEAVKKIPVQTIGGRHGRPEALSEKRRVQPKRPTRTAGPSRARPKLSIEVQKAAPSRTVRAT